MKTTLPDVKWINPTQDVIQWKGTENMEMMRVQNSKQQNIQTDWLLGVHIVGTALWYVSVVMNIHSEKIY